MSPSDIEARPKEKVERREETTRPEHYFRPLVDIFESKDELTLLVDMPGVSADALDIHVEGDELAIAGRVRPTEYEGLKPLHVEYGVGGYYRRFTVGETIDRDGIKAQMRNGVLALRLPKTEQARVRRIAVQAA
jgi:HSP20 family protein